MYALLWLNLILKYSIDCTCIEFSLLFMFVFVLLFKIKIIYAQSDCSKLNLSTLRLYLLPTAHIH